MGKKSSSQVRKKPGDYPQFAIRVSEREKERFEEALKEIAKDANEKQKRSKKRLLLLRRNDVFVKALDEGLKWARKNVRKLTPRKDSDGS